MDFEKGILKISCELYTNLGYTRSDIQNILNTVGDFIKNTYNPFLLKTIMSALCNAVNDEVMKEINKIFKKYKDPFSLHSSEKKRLVLYRKNQLLVEPIEPVVDTRKIMSSKGSKVFLNIKDITIAYMTIENSFKKLLEIDGLFNVMMSYMNHLQNQSNVFQNLVQGSLWKNKLEHYEQTKLNAVCNRLLKKGAFF